ncbi:MAG: RNA-binding protein [Coprococcus sp.]
MTSEETILQKRFADLKRQSDFNNRYTYSDFLNLAEQELFYQSMPEISAQEFCLWGGFADAERKVVRFGSPELLWYNEDFPLTCIVIKPVSAKFAEKLSHRDVLGALMNLGIERKLLGDIVIKESCCYVMCLTKIADFIVSELRRIKHTDVTCSLSEVIPADTAPDLQEISQIVSSLRADAIISKVFHLSRNESDTMFSRGLVFLNGRVLSKSSSNLKPEDVVSVRGYGKFRFAEVIQETKKGNLSIRIYKYI